LLGDLGWTWVYIEGRYPSAEIGREFGSSDFWDGNGHMKSPAKRPK
jgi:hypothetical protein